MIRERDTLMQELAVLMSSGMSLISSLGTLKEEIKSRRLKARITALEEEVANGSSFWSALKRAHLLHPSFLPLVRIGEESGQLAQHILLIARAQEKDRTLRGKITSALLYPSFIVVVMGLVASSTTAFILPRLATLFRQLDVPLPLVTRMMIDAGVFLRHYGGVLGIAGVVCVALLVAVWRSYPRMRYAIQEIVFCVPGSKPFFQSIELTRFGFLLGTLLAVGVPILDALHALGDATPFKRYKDAYAYLEESIEEGNSFEKSFQLYPHINAVMPLSVRQMVIAGEQSGNLSEALFAVSRRYEEQGERLSKNIPALLEPTLLVVVWLGVVAVALAVILPLYRLVGSFH